MYHDNNLKTISLWESVFGFFWKTNFTEMVVIYFLKLKKLVLHSKTTLFTFKSI